MNDNDKQGAYFRGRIGYSLIGLAEGSLKSDLGRSCLACMKDKISTRMVT